MGEVIASITTSVDGYVTSPYDGPEYGLSRGGERLHFWVMGGPWIYQGGHDFSMHGLLARGSVQWGGAGPGREPVPVSEPVTSGITLEGPPTWDVERATLTGTTAPATVQRSAISDPHKAINS